MPGPPAPVDATPGAIFECQDGPIVIMARQQREWEGLVRAMGSPDWAQDERFADPRVIARDYADDADAFLKPWIAERGRSEIRALGEQFGFPVAPIRTVGENLDDPQLRHREFFEPLGGGAGDAVLLPGVPFKTEHAETVTPGHPPERRAPASMQPVRGPGHPAVQEAPLTGIRVLDLTWVWSGPMVTSIFADLGAEVIKIENAARPDPARARGRAVRDGQEVGGPALECSPYFNQLGHDKKSVAIDFTSPEGREAILDLARSCHLVVENMRPGVLERHGLGYRDFAEVNPSIVVESMTMMGQTGPTSGQMGYGVIMAGLAGLEGLAGYDEETTGMFNLALSDPIAGSHATFVALAALYRAQRTGQGAWIDLSQMECTLSCLIEPLLEWQRTGEIERPQNAYTDATPYGHYRALGDDQWVAVAVWTAGQRTKLREFLPPSEGGPLDSALAAWIAARDPADAASSLRTQGIMAAPVHDYEQLRTTGWFEERGFEAVLDHAYLGDQAIMGVPWEIGGFRARPTHSSPLLGQHTREVLEDVLGLEPEAIAALQADSVGASH